MCVPCMCPTHVYAGVCADKYIWSDLNSNECPSNSSRITGERDCFLSATAAGMQPSGNLNAAVPDRPKGCYWASYGNVWQVWLNNVAVGARNPFSRLMCAKDDVCDAGTYKPPTSATGCNPCCDCEAVTAKSGRTSLFLANPLVIRARRASLVCKRKPLPRPMAVWPVRQART